MFCINSNSNNIKTTNNLHNKSNLIKKKLTNKKTSLDNIIHSRPYNTTDNQILTSKPLSLLNYMTSSNKLNQKNKRNSQDLSNDSLNNKTSINENKNTNQRRNYSYDNMNNINQIIKLLPPQEERF